jgi:hypothetical protein
MRFASHLLDIGVEKISAALVYHTIVVEDSVLLLSTQHRLRLETGADPACGWKIVNLPKWGIPAASGDCGAMSWRAGGH